MPLLVIFIVWYVIYAKNNPKVYRKIGDKISKIIVGLILLSFLSSFIPAAFGVSIGLLVILCVFGLPVIFFIWLIKNIFGGNSNRNKKSDYTYYQNNYQTADNKKRTYGTVTGLTKTVSKRRKIVEKFNKKYDLNLTEQEIDRIVDASYMSNCWEREIYDMDQSYDSVYQWYNSESGWLRAYLRAFSVQSVSSDFEMQRKICLDTYDQIFRDVNPGKYNTIDECVEDINERYFTFFDESIFMIAYRFLEYNGRRHELPHPGAMKNESEIDILQRKYDKTDNVGQTLNLQ